MKCVRVTITRWVSDQPQPGIVECQFSDARGHLWTFHEKIQVVSGEDLWNDTLYPRQGVIAVTVCDGQPANADEYDIDTSRPWDIESLDGSHIFRVPASILID